MAELATTSKHFMGSAAITLDFGNGKTLELKTTFGGEKKDPDPEVKSFYYLNKEVKFELTSNDRRDISNYTDYIVLIDFIKIPAMDIISDSVLI